MKKTGEGRPPLTLVRGSWPASPDNAPACSLRVWLQQAEADPLKGNSDLRNAARRLLNDPDMRLTWKALSARGDQSLQVFFCVRDAIRRAHEEVSVRKGPRDEQAAYDRVSRLAAELREAIEASPLPRRSSGLVSLTGNHGVPTAELWIAWREGDESTQAPGYTMSFVKMLDILQQMVHSNMSGLPPRALKRQRERPLNTAFVRWLNWLLGAPGPTHVARISNAVLGSTFDKNDVRAMLRDQPAAFNKPRPDRLRRALDKTAREEIENGRST